MENFGFEIAKSILHQWNKNYKIFQKSAHEILYSWLDYRLDKNQAPELHNFITTECRLEPEFVIGGRALVNPLWFCHSNFAKKDTQSRFYGRIHGDLHAGNILVSRIDPDSKDFWLIDFALSADAPLFYDVAYLELSLLLNHLSGCGPERILGIVEELSKAEIDKSPQLPISDVGIYRYLRNIRTSCQEWQKEVELNRLDAVDAQHLLSRVAAALNWCNKPLDNSVKRLALAYGAFSAKQYLDTFHPKWNLATFDRGTAHATPSKIEASIPHQDDSQWNLLWDFLANFNPSLSKHILVTDRIQSAPDLASLGMLPWAAIIDLDPYSDTDGLYFSAGPVLEKSRAVHQFGRIYQSVEFYRGTAWIMASGWPSRHEPAPNSLKDWRRLYLPLISEAFDDIRRSVAPQKVKILALCNQESSKEKISRILERVDEHLEELADVAIIGMSAKECDSIEVTEFDITIDKFVKSIRLVYGTEEDLQIPKVPGILGPVGIAIDDLRNFEEDLDIIHSLVLTNDNLAHMNDDVFWRGAAPRWSDLHDNLDVLREIHPELVREIDRALSQSRNHTIELHHAPGAGGTTAALRAAWTFRNEYTTAVLRRYSRYSVDRIDKLFQISQKPVLIIADASELPPSNREDLYRGLANRNARVVILYVVRSINISEDKILSIGVPMSKVDANAFLSRYVPLCKSQKQKNLLSRIANSPVSDYSSFCSPFFFGLATFERDFTSIDRYVNYHTQNIAHKSRQILLYLSLVTRYSQTGIDEAIISSFLGMNPNKKLDLDEALGAGPAKLVIKQGRRLKLLHPLIAEEVLKKLLGGSPLEGWKYGLKDLALEFINNVVDLFGEDSDEANKILFQVFILRDVWYENQLKGRPRFSEIIMSIPSKEGQHQVLELLTIVCPNEAHYWNHLGRHQFYEFQEDFEAAQELLQKAVELSPGDSYHHHSLGMVRRFWIERLINEQLANESPSAEQILKLVGSIFADAEAAFSMTRELNPDDSHGYITHMQMLLHTADRLVRLSGNDLSVATSRNGDVSDWLKKNVVIAEELLVQVQHQRGQGKPSQYELSCISKLAALYNDFDQVIKTWEDLLDKGKGDADLRRALSFAYSARAKRIWSALPQPELRRISNMMEANLKLDPASDRDIRVWFQSYRRLPEYSHFEALDRLSAWASRTDSVDASYYLYIIHFLKFIDGISSNESVILSNLARCKELAQGHRSHSFEWLGSKPGWCPLLHHTELGEWDRALNFYPNTMLLRYVEGTIETIKGPQAGTIRIGQHTRAFFVPGTQQWASKNINDLVHFYVGFSYDGLRAWSVQPGSAPAQEITHQNNAPDTPYVQEDTSRVILNFGNKEIDDYLEKLRTFILELIVEHADKHLGEFIHLSTIGEKVTTFFGSDIYKAYNFRNLSNFMHSIDDVELVNSGNSPRVTHTLDEIDITTIRNRIIIKNFVLSYVDLCLIKNREPLISSLGQSLSMLNKETNIYDNLGIKKLTNFLYSICEIYISGEKETATVHRK